MKRRAGAASASNLSRDELRALALVELQHSVKLRSAPGEFEGGYRVSISREDVVFTSETHGETIAHRIADISSVSLDYETGVLSLDDVGLEVVCHDQATIGALRRVVLSMVDLYEDSVRRQRHEAHEEVALLEQPPAAEFAVPPPASTKHTPGGNVSLSRSRYEAPVLAGADPAPPRPDPTVEPSSPLAATGLGPGRGSVRRASLPPHNVHSATPSVASAATPATSAAPPPAGGIHGRSPSARSASLAAPAAPHHSYVSGGGSDAAPPTMRGPAHAAAPPQGDVYHLERGGREPTAAATAAAPQQQQQGMGGTPRHPTPSLSSRGGSPAPVRAGMAPPPHTGFDGGEVLPPPASHPAAFHGHVAPRGGSPSFPPAPPQHSGALVLTDGRASLPPLGAPAARDRGAMVASFAAAIKPHPPLVPAKLDTSSYPLPAPAAEPFPTLGPAITQTRLVDLVQEPSSERGKLLLLLAKAASGATLVAAYNGHPEVELYVEMWSTPEITPAAEGVTRTTHPQYHAEVLGLVVHPGETKEFVAGFMKEDPQPGWKTQPLSDDSMTRRRKALEQKVFDDYQRLQALVEGDAPEADVLAMAMSRQVPYIDLWFLPQPSSLAKPHEAAADTDVETWGRPTAFLPPGQTPGVLVTQPSPNDIDMGVGGHAWLPCLLACLAEYAAAGCAFDPIERIFAKHKAEYEEVGAWRLVLCREGWWRDVVVDSYLPMLRRPKRSLVYCPAYTNHLGHRREMWGAAIEKACARLAGSYSAITAGYFHEGLMDLTGFPAERLPWEETRDTTLFEDLMAQLHADHTLLILHTPNATGDEAQEAVYAKNSLMQGYGYPILQMLAVEGHRLIRIRNPWPSKGHWQGRWCDGSENWANCPAVAAAAQYQGGGDGTAWLAWPEVLDWFEGCTALHYIPHAGELRLALPFQNSVPGYVLEVSVKTPTKVFVGVHMKDQRNKPHPAPYGCMNVTVLQTSGDHAGQWQRLHEDYEWGAKDFLGTYEFTPEGGTYLICVHDYDGGTEGGRITDDVVVSLHYLPLQTHGPTVEGNVSIKSAAPAIEAIQYNPVVIKDPLAPVEAYAQVRRHIASQDHPAVHQLVTTVHL